MIRTSYWQILACLLLIALLAVGGAGCKKKDKDLNTGLEDTDAGADMGAGSEATTGEGLPDVDLTGLNWDPNDPSSPDYMEPVYFDYNSSSLRSDAIQTLQRNAEVMKKYPGAIIQIAGHCDERGTQEYNFALGERRALSVREYLIQLGVSGDRMITISFGEEMPVDFGHNEAAWSKNRRGEFNKAAAP